MDASWTGRLAVVLTVLVVVAGCGSSGSDDIVGTDDDRVGAAEALCPVMWEWVTAVGDTFNDASRSMADLPDPDDRRARWLIAFDDMDGLTTALGEKVASLAGDPILDPLIDQIEDGIVASGDEVEGLRTLLAETPEVDAGRHQDRTQQLIVRVEKVIDVVKPRLAEQDDPALIDAFRSVPSCQHAVKDVDDGTPRYNG